MLPLEPLFCPCCTPALLHSLAHTNLSRVPQQILWLGTSALAATLQQQQKSRSQRAARKLTARPSVS